MQALFAKQWTRFGEEPLFILYTSREFLFELKQHASIKGLEIHHAILNSSKGFNKTHDGNTSHPTAFKLFDIGSATMLNL
ncbi:MAG: hypothetical protein ACU843_14715 [Gammaproteobacteria bacterium]